MLIIKFIAHYRENIKTETDKIAYIAFFHLKHANIINFNRDDVREWFSVFPSWPEPNISRLWCNHLKNNNRFNKGKNNTYKLSEIVIKNLDDECSKFDFDEVYVKLKTASGYYVSLDRLSELKNINNTNFDLLKLIALCEELNKCIKTECKLSIGLLVRTLIDHIPPIFQCKNFSEVCNNYSGSRSFKQSMQKLDSSSRKISDRITHEQVRNKEILPTLTQVDFTNDVDVLLGEVVRILK